MLISHRHRFIVFPDPLNTCHWLTRALGPWVDQPVAARKGDALIFQGMTPAEVELAFDMMGYRFRDYARIAIVQDPYARLAQLYDRIAEVDRLWQLRGHLGLDRPNFYRWLSQTRPNGVGAGWRFSPRWRRHAAWSAARWCDGRINHVIRAEHAGDDLANIFYKLQIAPAFSWRTTDQQILDDPAGPPVSDRSRALIKRRYRSDFALLAGIDAAA